MTLSCGVKQEKFNKLTWNDRADMYYANRESMVEDLMNNYLKKGMSYEDVINLLDQPENYTNVEDYTVHYEIYLDYGWDIDPVEGTDLVIKFSKDSIITNFGLTDWGKPFLN
jgi:hypothetical protein